ncbi:MAG: thiolase family protein [Deltaproteobacteria bacterium]|nr:thiolase family protein [Deltaproteobacteria bacterium]
MKPVYVMGRRSAFVRSFGVFEDCDALEILSRTTDGLLRALKLEPSFIDDFIVGTVIPQTKNPNIARDTILNLGIAAEIPGYTINRSCFSGLQTVINASMTIQSGYSSFVLTGGVENLSDVPVMYSREARKFLVRLAKARSASAKLNIIKHFRAKAWLPHRPDITEPLTGLSMGLYAETIARSSGISRKDQDLYAAESHRRGANAQEKGLFLSDIIPVWPSPEYSRAVSEDDIIGLKYTDDDFIHQKPMFDKRYGLITGLNSPTLTDGAAVCLIADEAAANAHGLTPSLRILSWDVLALDPWKEFLTGPPLTIARLLKKTGMNIKNIDLFEIHESCSAQVLSCLSLLNSDEFSSHYLGKSKAIGAPEPDKVNVNGGAIAIGHPFGATGLRMLITLERELKAQDLHYGIIVISSPGGITGSLLVERI